MIDLLVTQGGNPDRQPQFLQKLRAHIAALEDSARRESRQQVAEAESAIADSPDSVFSFDANACGILSVPGGQLHCGRFDTPTIGELLDRASAARTGDGRVRLWVLGGVSPATDIGGLQAAAGQGSLFQVASQFNCLESPGPYITPVANYFHDPTQGPRACISAYPGALLRHYAAPDGAGGRFVQTSGGSQINLLDNVCAPGMAAVTSGYLTPDGIADPGAFADRLETHFGSIRVGVHAAVPVMLGYNWDGAVTGDRQITQVLTSTLAAGAYGSTRGDEPAFDRICTQLLRAAYLGTLLAAVNLGRTKVVLTLIGGGVFGNPHALIWDSICWAVETVRAHVTDTLDVVVNARNLGEGLTVDGIMPTVRRHDGVIVMFGQDGISIVR